jgi:hypothetical protein
MREESNTVCPWCDTEIVWDPEFGPEEQCPHCFNDLGEYRSVNLGGTGIDGEGEDDADTGDAGVDGDEDVWPDEEYDAYGVKVEQCVDMQEEAPECPRCGELMLFAGDRKLDGFNPSAPAPLGQAFLKTVPVLSMYVCPSCFRTESFLSEQDRLEMVQAFKSNG